MTVKHPQSILAIDESYLSQVLGAVDGANQIPFDQFMAGVGPHLVIRRRHELESNENYLQILPYALMVRGSTEEEGIKGLKFAAYYRPVSGGEERLHGNVSIGFGGHIDLADVKIDEKSVIDFQNTVIMSMQRELTEELGLKVTDLVGGQILGYRLITDKSNSVGRVHLGMAFIILTKDVVEFNPEETEVDYAGEFTAAELLAKHEAGEIVLENWTKLLVDSILAE